MLSTAKPILQQQIKSIIGSKDVAKVFEEAYLSTLPTQDVDEIEDQTAKQNAKQDIQDTAEQFGQLCAYGLDKAITQKLTDAIDTYVKSIGLIITPAALTSPVGPVSGVITTQEIQII